MFTEFIRYIKIPRWLVSGEDTMAGGVGVAIGPVYIVGPNFNNPAFDRNYRD